MRADAVQGAQRVDIGSDAQIADGSGADQVLGAVARTAIGVDDDCPLAGKILEQSRANRLHDLADGARVVVGRHSDEDVYFADVDQLADKIVGEGSGFWQSSSRVETLLATSLNQILLNLNQ